MDKNLNQNSEQEETVVPSPFSRFVTAVSNVIGTVLGVAGNFFHTLIFGRSFRSGSDVINRNLEGLNRAQEKQRDYRNVNEQNSGHGKEERTVSQEEKEQGGTEKEVQKENEEILKSMGLELLRTDDSRDKDDPDLAGDQKFVVINKDLVVFTLSGKEITSDRGVFPEMPLDAEKLAQVMEKAEPDAVETLYFQGLSVSEPDRLTGLTYITYDDGKIAAGTDIDMAHLSEKEMHYFIEDLDAVVDTGQHRDCFYTGQELFDYEEKAIKEHDAYVFEHCDVKPLYVGKPSECETGYPEQQQFTVLKDDVALDVHVSLEPYYKEGEGMPVNPAPHSQMPFGMDHFQNSLQNAEVNISGTFSAHGLFLTSDEKRNITLLRNSDGEVVAEIPEETLSSFKSEDAMRKFMKEELPKLEQGIHPDRTHTEQELSHAREKEENLDRILRAVEKVREEERSMPEREEPERDGFKRESEKKDAPVHDDEELEI